MRFVSAHYKLICVIVSSRRFLSSSSLYIYLSIYLPPTSSFSVILPFFEHTQQGLLTWSASKFGINKMALFSPVKPHVLLIPNLSLNFSSTMIYGTFQYSYRTNIYCLSQPSSKNKQRVSASNKSKWTLAFKSVEHDERVGVLYNLH